MLLLTLPGIVVSVDEGGSKFLHGQMVIRQGGMVLNQNWRDLGGNSVL